MSRRGRRHLDRKRDQAARAEGPAAGEALTAAARRQLDAELDELPELAEPEPPREVSKRWTERTPLREVLRDGAPLSRTYVRLVTGEGPTMRCNPRRQVGALPLPDGSTWWRRLRWWCSYRWAVRKRRGKVVAPVMPGNGWKGWELLQERARRG